VLYNTYRLPDLTLADLESARYLATQIGDAARADEVTLIINWIRGPQVGDPPPDPRRTMVWVAGPALYEQSASTPANSAA
jgi:hypothetical protein